MVDEHDDVVDEGTGGNGGNGGNGNDGAGAHQQQATGGGRDLGATLALILAIIAILALLAYAVYDRKDAREASTAQAELAKVVLHNRIVTDETLATKADASKLDALTKTVVANKVAADSALANRPTLVEVEKYMDDSSKRIAKEFRAELANKADASVVDALGKTVGKNATVLKATADLAIEFDKRLSGAESELDTARQESEKLRKALAREKYARRKAEQQKAAEDARKLAAKVDAATTSAKQPMTDALATRGQDNDPPRVRVTLRLGPIPE